MRNLYSAEYYSVQTLTNTHWFTNAHCGVLFCSITIRTILLHLLQNEWMNERRLVQASIQLCTCRSITHTQPSTVIIQNSFTNRELICFFFSLLLHIFFSIIIIHHYASLQWVLSTHRHIYRCIVLDNNNCINGYWLLMCFCNIVNFFLKKKLIS